MRCLTTASVIAVCLLAGCSTAGVAANRPSAGGVARGQAAPSSPMETFAAVPPAGRVVRTIPFSPRDTELFATDGPRLDVVVVPAGNPTTIMVDRASGADGVVNGKRLSFPRAAFLSDVAVGPRGVYLGTSVIKRFTNTPDVLARLDPTTLMVAAETSFPARVQALAQGRYVWASIGDGRVVRLDPCTLAIQRSVRVLPERSTVRGAGSVSAPALGLGSLWVLAGDEHDLDLIRMNPRTLAVRSKTHVRTGGESAQSLNTIAADENHVYLTGGGFVRVDADGTLDGPPTMQARLAAVAIHRAGLVAVTDPPTSLVLLAGDGRVEARTPLADAGGFLAVGGDTAWLLGNAGHGDGIVQIHITRP